MTAVFSIAVAAQAAGEPHPFVRCSGDSGAKRELLMDLRDGAEAADTNGVTWRLGVESAAVAGRPDARDYRLTWTVSAGQVESASVGVTFAFKDWSPEDFVLVPAAVYDGNRFEIKQIGYPPYWYNTNECLVRSQGDWLYMAQRQFQQIKAEGGKVPKAWMTGLKKLLPICASWVVAYDYHFPTNSAMGQIDAHSCGAVWANVANKHGAPAICTWSGDSLLKYYRATGDRRALELLTDIAHGVPQ